MNIWSDKIFLAFVHLDLQISVSTASVGFLPGRCYWSQQIWRNSPATSTISVEKSECWSKREENSRPGLDIYCLLLTNYCIVSY